MNPPVDYDIIFLALARWDGPYSSTAYSLAKALSTHARVFYVDNPFTIKDYFAEKRTPQIQRRSKALWRGRDMFTKPDPTHPNLVSVTPRITLSINWMPDGFVYDVFSRINDTAMSIAINQTCRQYNIRRYVLVNSFNPLVGRHLQLEVRPLLRVYQSVDDISQSNYVNKHGVRLEAEAVKSADITLVTSSELKRLKSVHSKNVFLLPNAADTAIFNTALTDDLAKPAEIEALPPDKKVICYMGNICHRIDYELLVKVAKYHSDKILLMIGPFGNDAYKRSGLAALPNVVFTGKKQLMELPAYLKYTDCCLIPFLCNQLTRSIYPLKINEYLSAGKPVVATRFSTDIEAFSEVIHVASTHDEFLSAIDTAISENSAEQSAARIEFSAGNNWDARACHFIELLAKQKTKKEIHGGEPVRAGIQAV